MVRVKRKINGVYNYLYRPEATPMMAPDCAPAKFDTEQDAIAFMTERGIKITSDIEFETVDTE